MVWHDGPVVLTTCPVLDLNAPRVQEALAWFGVTHDIAYVGMSGHPVWQLVRLPAAGPAGAQSHWLMAAMTVVRQTLNQRTSEVQRRAVHETPADDDE